MDGPDRSEQPWITGASTEPRPRGRGWVAGRVEGEHVDVASTEPRPRGRGWLELPEDAKRLPVASTEPRPRGRGWEVAVGAEAPVQMLQRSPDLAVGDGATSSPRRRGPSSFNGAPTSRSGMGPSSEECLATPVCFNGAPTSRSGMVAPPGLEGLRLLASTEPRPRGRGWAEGRARRGVRGLASTEPRPRGRGWDLTALESLYALVLQRSPDLAVGDGS